MLLEDMALKISHVDDIEQRRQRNLERWTEAVSKKNPYIVTIHNVTDRDFSRWIRRMINKKQAMMGPSYYRPTDRGNPAAFKSRAHAVYAAVRWG